MSKKNIWNDESTDKSKILMISISAIIFIFALMVVRSDLTYENLCPYGIVEFDKTQLGYTHVEFMKIILCDYPLPIIEEPHYNNYKFGNNFSQNNLNVEVKEILVIDNEFADELDSKRFFVSVLLYFIKINVGLALIFFSFIPLFFELKKEYSDTLKNGLIWAFAFWNFLIGFSFYLGVKTGWF